MLRFNQQEAISSIPGYLADPDLPGLKEALDGHAMRGFCRRLLTADNSATVIDCRVTRLRYRRAKRCIIQYQMTLRLADDSTRTHWLAALLYADKNKFRTGTRRLEKLITESVPVDGLLGGAVIEEAGLLIRRFPFDRRLPTLAPFVFDIEQLIGDYLPVLLDSHDWNLESLDVNPVRWRVGLSAVLALHLRLENRHNGSLRRHRLFAKLDATGAKSTTRSRLRQAEASGDLPFSLPRTLLSMPRQGITIQNSARGMALDSLLDARLVKPAHATSFAQMLARWHCNGDQLQIRYSRQDFETALTRTVRILTTAAPGCSARLERLAEGIRGKMVHGSYRPIHLDLKPEHIFFDTDRITLIDIESAVDGDPMLDITILYARMFHAKALYDLPQQQSRNFALQFLSSYHQLVPAFWWHNFPASYAWALLKVATHLFTCQRPRWRDWTHRFVSEAESALNSPDDNLPSLLRNARQTAAPNRVYHGSGMLVSDRSMG
jgi:hypothetical protein